MGGFTPLECFFAGTAIASTGLALLLFFVLRAVVKQRRQDPDPLAGGGDEGANLLRLRLQDVERRVAELEMQTRPYEKA